jgi:RNA polymerase sigma-70 factor (ECF subfamily)
MERVLTPELAPVLRDSAARELDDFDAMARLYQGRIFRFLLASLRDRDAAENLTQDCLIRAYQARARFRGDASVATWLMQIAVNLVRSHLTSSRLKFWRRASKASVDLSVAQEWLADPQLSPEAMALAKQRVAAVWEAVGSLSPRQRTVFVLRFVEEMELLEIAAATGMKEGTVKAHLFRALEAVRTRIEASK